MTAAETLDRLRAAGKEPYRKTYRRHGVRGEVCGVSTADMKALKKAIRVDDALARELWSSGVHEARVLATMIADPAKLDDAALDSWSRDLDSYVIVDAFAEVASRTASARAKTDEWIAAADEWLASTGWRVLAHGAMKNAALPDSYFVPRIETIVRDIGTAKNRVKHEMNSALIAIGARSEALAAQATAAAHAIGVVEVDHGDTACVTPDAAAYIAKTRARKR